MPGPKERQDRAPEREEQEREPQGAPATETDVERDAPAQPQPDVEHGRDMVERRPHRDEP